MDTQSSSGSFMERYLTPIAVILGAAIIAVAVIYGRDAVSDPSKQASYIDALKTASEAVEGIDTARVEALIEEKQQAYAAAITASREEGSTLGINGTPSVVIGNQLLSGKTPEEFYNDIAAVVNAGAPAVPGSLITKVTTEGEPTIGNANAPVTMAYFFDYQCGFCHQFKQVVLPRLYEDFVKTGKLKIVMKDFQFLSQDSFNGALFGRAVYELFPEQYDEWIIASAAVKAGH